MVKQKNRGDKEVENVEEQLKKAQGESIAEQEFQYGKSIPLTRMQTEAEFAQKSARAKALEMALTAAGTGKEGGDDECEDVFALQAAKADKAAKVGLSLAQKPKKNTDKSLRDIFKIGSHILK